MIFLEGVYKVIVIISYSQKKQLFYDNLFILETCQTLVLEDFNFAKKIMGILQIKNIN